MISIPDYSDMYIKKYIDDIGNKIYSYAMLQKDFWIKYFPECNDHGNIDKKFFDDILSLTIDELCEKYESIKTYYQFAFFSSLNIHFIHMGEPSRKCRKDNRKIYIKTYVEKNEIANRILKCYLKKGGNPISTDKDFEKLQSYMKKGLKIINDNIKKTINYNTIIKCKHRVDILDDLNIKVCPYCNRQYVVKLDINMGKVIGDIDHFYSQNYFALFGLSLYNFVPSCKICNSLFKSDINADIQYPYRMTDESNISFEIANEEGELTPGNIYGWNDNFYINVIGKSPEQQKADREINFFSINAQYALHKGYAKELLYKKNIITTSLITQLESYLNSIQIQLSRKQIKEVLYGIDIDDIDIREKPLAKLTKDLYEKY